MSARALLVLLSVSTPLGVATPARAEQAPRPRYALQMEQEFEAMGVEARCSSDDAQSAHCVYSGRSSTTARDFEVHAVYSDRTDSIYFYVASYLKALPQAPGTNALLRRLMELNWELLVGKFEWNPRTGEVRLGAVLNTDSNFDRRSFRSIVKSLDTLAARYHRELSGLLAPTSSAK